jgi:hypothetical protein
MLKLSTTPWRRTLYLIKHEVLTYGGSRLTPIEVAGWVDPRTDLDVVARRKIHVPAGSRSPVV